MFEEAVRNKYRFPSNVGMINVEDLWDLSIERLDYVYKTLKSELKSVAEESLLNKETDADKEVQNKITIVQHIFDTKTAEKEARGKLIETAQKKQHLLSILKEKQNDEYKGKSVEELQQLIDQL